MKIEKVPIDSLKPDPHNARAHDKRTIEAIARSLSTFQQQRPLVVTPAGEIAAGNGTYAAAKLLGWTEIEVVRTNLTGLQLRAYKIADNRTGDLSGWSYDNLADILQSLQDEDANLLEAAGFLEHEATAILAASDNPPEDEPPPTVFEPVKPKTDGQSHALHFTPEQWDIVYRAISKFRDVEQDQKISGSRCLELLCADFISGN